METIEKLLDCETRRKYCIEIEEVCGGREISKNHMSFRLCNIFRCSESQLCRTTETQRERPSVNPTHNQCKSLIKFCLLTLKSDPFFNPYSITHSKYVR